MPRRSALPDHHDFATLPWPPATRRDVIVTEKDAVKLRRRAPSAARVWVAPLDFEPEPGFADALLRSCHRLDGRPPRLNRYHRRMETRLLELLVCPVCKGPLQHWRPPQHARQELRLPAPTRWPSRSATASR